MKFAHLWRQGHLPFQSRTIIMMPPRSVVPAQTASVMPSARENPGDFGAGWNPSTKCRKRMTIKILADHPSPIPTGNVLPWMRNLARWHTWSRIPYYPNLIIISCVAMDQTSCITKDNNSNGFPSKKLRRSLLKKRKDLVGREPFFPKTFFIPVEHNLHSQSSD